MSERRIRLNQEHTPSGGGGCCGNCMPCKGEAAQDIPVRPYDHLFKLVLVGDSGVGRTSLLLRFADDTFTTGYMCTIGIDFKIKTIELDGKKIKLQIWDPSGGERFHTILPSYFRGTHGFMVLYDTTDQDSFSNVFEKWLILIQENTSKSCKRMLVGTKCDLEDQRVIEYENAKELAGQHDMLFFETSSKDNINVEEAFITLVAEVKQLFPDIELKQTSGWQYCRC